MSKRINILLFLSVSLLIVLTVVIQSSFQHWSAQWDLDFWYIYNASLMSSGIEQEWYDHPATTILSLYSFFYKIYSLFDHSFIYKINEIMESSDPDLVLQKLYFVTRIFDSINIILIIFFTFKVSKILSSNNFYAYFLTLTLIFSAAFFNNLSLLGPEDWAILFFLISFYYFLRFFIESKITFLILSGIFFLFSFFSKISILFLFIFIIALIPLFYEIYSKKKESFLQKIIEKNFLILFSGYLILLFIYFIIQIFIFSKLAPFEKNAGLDAIMIFILNFSYMVFFLIISKFNINRFKKYFSIFLIFFLGFFIGLFILVILDIFNITTLNPWLIFHVTNPFNEMIRFVGIEGSSIKAANLLDSTLVVLETFFSNFIFDKFLLFFLFLVGLISFFEDKKNKNLYNFLFKLVILLCFLINVLIFNFRFFYEYAIYAYALYIILFSVCLKNLSVKVASIFCIILFFYTPVFVTTQNFDNFYSLLKTRPSILEETLCKNSLGSFKYYSKKFNENTYKKLCN